MPTQPKPYSNPHAGTDPGRSKSCGVRLVRAIMSPLVAITTGIATVLLLDTALRIGALRWMSASFGLHMSPSILLDDADLTLLIGAQWERSTNASSAHNRSTTTCSAQLNGKGIKYTKNPRLTINLPSLNALTFFNYSFKADDSDLRQADLSPQKDLVGKTGVELWTINNAESSRLAVYPDFGNFTLDYVLITPDKSEGFSGNVMMMDDRDTAIKYDSQWTPNENQQLPRAVPMKGSLTKAVNTGAKFDVQFTGSNIAVYGVLNSVAGKLSSSYAIDKGSPTTMTHFDWLVQMFFKQNVSPGTHTLTMTLNEVTGNQSFYLDYITFLGIEQTQLNATTAAAKKPSTIGGIVGGAIASPYPAWLLRGLGKKKMWSIASRIQRDATARAEYLDSTLRHERLILLGHN
ncbi:hypothetical protein DFP72DRAFT_908981 [Ephemerocybe angulata]|uniref:Uncharacterized protein n=1 Tax=Ephemerocybe angulata TaxID=980116 RepID=A0A8H6HRF7_9AGAR|nr:hypothetical protein DFP72DRAFT_908981 [Tulosesus angulatus]